MPFLLWLSQAEAAVFDLHLFIGGVEYTEFGSIQISRSISGIGTTGLSTAELTVTVTAPVNAFRAAPVELRGVGNLPTFYIDSRVQSGSTARLTCLDRMAYTDETFLSEWVDLDADKKVKTSAVIDKITEKCGFGGHAGYSIPSYITDIDIAFIEGRSCADILSMLGDLQCGCWYCAAGNELTYMPMGSSSGSMAVTEHTSLKLSDEYRPAGVRVVNGSKDYERGDTTYAYDTIIINSDMGCDQTAADVFGRISGKYFDAVSCEKCVIGTDIPYICCDVKFAENDTVYRITGVTAYIEGTGIMCSLTANAPTGGEISRRSKLARAIDNAGNGKKGNMMITPYQGIIYLEDEE
ncbi:MAG: hypothetical protein ACI4KF_00710 [Huintestinicola sp.]